MSLISSRRYLSIRELSQVTSLKPSTIYRWAEEGRIPGKVKLGGRLVFREDRVLQWLDEQERLSA